MTSLTTRRLPGGADRHPGRRRRARRDRQRRHGDGDSQGREGNDKGRHFAPRLATSPVGCSRILMARRANQAATKPEPPTRVLLVRHGQTDSTGKVLPGRAGASTSPTRPGPGRAVAERIATARPSRPCTVFPRTRPADGGADRHGDRRRAGRQGLIECDFGDWTGEQLCALMKPPEWSHRAALTVGVSLSRRRELRRDAGAHRRRRSTAAGRRSRRDDRVRVARRPDQGGRSRARSARTSTCSNGSSSAPPR